jgi:hypothetical protein
VKITSGNSLVKATYETTSISAILIYKEKLKRKGIFQLFQRVMLTALKNMADVKKHESSVVCPSLVFIVFSIVFCHVYHGCFIDRLHKYNYDTIFVVRV